jgi:hypothetical protein
MKKSVLCLLATIWVAFSSPALADSYSFALDGSQYDVNGLVTTDPLNNVISISGLVTGPNGGAIDGLSPLGNPNWTYDDLFFGNEPYVTNGGILFSANGWDYNLYSVGSPGSFQYYLSTFNPDGAYYNPGDTGSLAVAAVPGPIVGSGITSLVIALGGLLGLARKRRNRAAPDLAAA